jgi:RHS repeat-associated protein
MGYLKRFSRENFGFSKKIWMFFCFTVIILIFSLFVSYPTSALLSNSQKTTSPTIITSELDTNKIIINQTVNNLSIIEITNKTIITNITINPKNFTIIQNETINFTNNTLINNFSNFSVNNPINNSLNISKFQNISKINNSLIILKNTTIKNITGIINITVGNFTNITNHSLQGILNITTNQTLGNQSNFTNLGENTTNTVISNLYDEINTTRSMTENITDEKDDFSTYFFNNQNPVIKTTYIYAGVLIASTSTDSNETNYYVQDHLGSNKEVIKGQIEEQSNDFYSFGETKDITGISNNNYKYTGKELDKETGFYQYGERYYNPTLGRFMQADSLTGDLQDPLSMNRYAYVQNNPLKFVDPTGNAPINTGRTITVTGVKPKEPLPENKPDATSAHLDMSAGNYFENQRVDSVLTARTQDAGHSVFADSVLNAPTKNDPNAKVDDFINTVKSEWGATNDEAAGKFIPQGNKILYDSMQTKTEPDSGLTTGVHEMSHAIDDTQGKTSQDHINTLKDYRSTTMTQTGEINLMSHLIEHYTENKNSIETKKDSIKVGREIGPYVDGLIVSHSSWLTPGMMKFSKLNDKTKTDQAYRDSLKQEFTKQK